MDVENTDDMSQVGLGEPEDGQPQWRESVCEWLAACVMGRART